MVPRKRKSYISVMNSDHKITTIPRNTESIIPEGRPPLKVLQWQAFTKKNFSSVDKYIIVALPEVNQIDQRKEIKAAYLKNPTNKLIKLLVR